MQNLQNAYSEAVFCYDKDRGIHCLLQVHEHLGVLRLETPPHLLWKF